MQEINPILTFITQKGEPRKLNPLQVATIAQAIESYADLLCSYWKDLESVRKDTKTASAQIALNQTFGFDAGNVVINSNIAFSRKYRDGREDVVSDPNQTQLFGGDAEATSRTDKVVKPSKVKAKDFGTPVSEKLDEAKKIKSAKK